MGRISKKDAMEALAEFFKPKQGGDTNIKRVSERQFILSANEDVELKLGRIAVDTGFVLNNGLRGVVTSLADSIQNGLEVCGGIRLTNSDVCPYVVNGGEDVRVYLKINDATLCSTHEGLNVRTRTCYVPKGLPIAMLTLI